MKITKKIRENLILVILPISFVTILLIILFKNQTAFQLELLVLLAIVYFISALVHHRVNKNLTTEVLLEYILIAIFVMILGLSILRIN